MDIIKIAALCIISSIMCSLFSKDNKEYSLYIKAAAACMILCGIIIYISPVIDSINNIFLRTGIESEYLTILFKAIGICYISQFAYDICKDCGENTLASQVEIAGKAALIMLAMPLIEKLVGIVTELSGY